MNNLQIFFGAFFFAILTVGTYEAAKMALHPFSQRSNVSSPDSPCYETGRGSS